jgi:hypothetical protein
MRRTRFQRRIKYWIIRSLWIMGFVQKPMKKWERERRTTSPFLFLCFHEIRRMGALYSFFSSSSNNRGVCLCFGKAIWPFHLCEKLGAHLLFFFSFSESSSIFFFFFFFFFHFLFFSIFYFSLYFLFYFLWTLKIFSCVF